MENWITDIMEKFGYVGILLMIALENVFPPIPSEVILTFGGFMTTYTKLTVPGVIIAATIGSVVGAVILYGIGRLLDVERLENRGSLGTYPPRQKKTFARRMPGSINTAIGPCCSAA